MNSIRRFGPILLLILVTAIPLWRPIFRGETIGAWDQINELPPTRAVSAGNWDVLQNDSVLQFYPWRKLVLESWGQANLPFWNPFELCGTPLLANSQSAAFYPPHIVFGVLHVPVSTSITLLAWLHLVVAGFGVYTLCRRFCKGQVGPIVGGISFALSPFMLGWTALPSVISTVAWIPWVLYCTFRCRELQTANRVVQLALCTAMMILAGHLQFAAYGGLAAALYVLLACRNVKFVVGAVAGLALGAVLAAPQLLPVLEYSKFSHRSNVASEQGYQAYVSTALQPWELASLANPTAFGNPTGTNREDGTSAYWPSKVKVNGNFAESAIGIGPLMLAGLIALAFAYRTGRQAVLPFAGVGVFFLLLATGSGLNRLLYFGVPGWSSSGSPGRAASLVVIVFCFLGGLGIDRLAQAPLRRIALITASFVSVLALLSLGLGSLAPLGVACQPAWVLGVALTVAGLFSFQKNSGWLILIPAVLGPCLLFATNLVRSGTVPDFPRSSAQRIAVINSSWGLLKASPTLMPPNLATLAGIHELGGYDSLVHRDTVALLRDVSGDDPAPALNGNMMFIKPTATPEKLASCGVTEVWVLTDGELRKIQIRSEGRVTRGVITHESLNSIQVEGVGPGRLVLRDRKMEGWSVYVDEAPAPLLGKTWLEVDLTPGKHKVDFEYSPPGLQKGLLLCLLGAFVVATLIIWRPKVLKSVVELS